MKIRYEISKDSHVIIQDKDTTSGKLYYGQHYKNNCGRGLESWQATTLAEMEQWVLRLRAVFNDKSNG